MVTRRRMQPLSVIGFGSFHENEMDFLSVLFDFWYPMPMYLPIEIRLIIHSFSYNSKTDLW